MDKKTKKTKKRIPKQKQKQKQKVIQKVSVNVSSSGGSGGSTMPSNYPSQQMIPNFIKSNEQEQNIIKSLVDLLNKPQTISKQPQEVFNIPRTQETQTQETQTQETPQRSVKLQTKNIKTEPMETQTEENFNIPLGNYDEYSENPVLNPPINTSNLNLTERVNESQKDSEDEPRVNPNISITLTKKEQQKLAKQQKEELGIVGLKDKILEYEFRLKNASSKQIGPIQRELNIYIKKLNELNELNNNPFNLPQINQDDSWITEK